jgi:hypothetical protein
MAVDPSVERLLSLSLSGAQRGKRLVPRVPRLEAAERRLSRPGRARVGEDGAAPGELVEAHGRAVGGRERHWRQIEAGEVLGGAVVLGDWEVERQGQVVVGVGDDSGGLISRLRILPVGPLGSSSTR